MAKGGGQTPAQSQWQQNYQNQQTARGDEAYGYSQGVRDDVTDFYRSQLSGEDGAGGGGGGYSYDPRWDSVASTGGFDPAQVSAMRGWGVPEEFARTGGFSDADKLNFRQRSNGAVTGIADSLRRGTNQRQTISGGYGPGYDAASGAMSRDAYRAASDAALNTEGTLASQVRSGRQWGAEAGAGNEQKIFGNQSGALQTIDAGRARSSAAGAANRRGNLDNQYRAAQALRETRGESGIDMDYSKASLQGWGAGVAPKDPGSSTGNRIMQGAAVAAPIVIAII